VSKGGTKSDTNGSSINRGQSTKDVPAQYCEGVTVITGEGEGVLLHNLEWDLKIGEYDGQWKRKKKTFERPTPNMWKGAKSSNE